MIEDESDSVKMRAARPSPYIAHAAMMGWGATLDHPPDPHPRREGSAADRAHTLVKPRSIEPPRLDRKNPSNPTPRAIVVVRVVVEGTSRRWQGCCMVAGLDR
ncbi:MAG: hypothetical protein R2939_17670 [Kofleriaceae bacterium]